MTFSWKVLNTVRASPDVDTAWGHTSNHKASRAKRLNVLECSAASNNNRVVKLASRNGKVNQLESWARVASVTAALRTISDVKWKTISSKHQTLVDAPVCAQTILDIETDDDQSQLEVLVVAQYAQSSFQPILQGNSTAKLSTATDTLRGASKGLFCYTTHPTPRKLPPTAP
eukprot:5309172-Amphidinium_carterae.1